MLMRALSFHLKNSVVPFVTLWAFIFGLFGPVIGCAQHPIQSEHDSPDTQVVNEDCQSDEVDSEYSTEEQPPSSVSLKD